MSNPYGYPPQGQHPQSGYGQPSQGQGGFNPARGALIQTPTISDMVDPNNPRWIARPVFPTAPLVPLNNNVGTQIRFYGASFSYQDSDYTVGSEMTRNVQFDIPCRVVAINGGGQYYDDSNNIQSLPTGYMFNDLYGIQILYVTGDKLHTGVRTASTTIGSGENPGEIGSTGVAVNSNSTISIIIIPKIANLKVDISFHCLEIRGRSNFS